ncbi:MAG: cation diffusion facilitator family transporter, partial [Melioribacteraceae bacterium]|nr:cation diffusion facilitator family transporter [Melioribacteraceae bacterium]
GYRVGWVSIILNTVLFILKYWVGIITGSIALIADAWHTISDSVSSVIVLIGVKISAKPADSEHPFGHGRAELIAAIIIGVILSIIAFNFAYESIQRLINQESVKYGTAAIVVTIISVIVKEGLAQYSLWAGKKNNLKSLIADAWHHRSDAISSVIILIGIFLQSIFPWIDGLLGFMVAILIFYASYEILHDAINPLLGEIPNEKLTNEIENICSKKIERNIHLHHLHLHDYGNHQELTFHIMLPGEMTVKDAHAIVDDIEQSIKEKLDIETTIHLDPL